MIVYEIPALYCECGMAIPKVGEAKLGGRLLYRCGNLSCRYFGIRFAVDPTRRVVEPEPSAPIELQSARSRDRM